MRFRPPGQEDEVQIELTSMTDIVFLLLIFFMVSTTFVDFSKRLDIQLPDTQAAEVVRDAQQHVIELGHEGALRLDGQVIQLENLTQQLQQRAHPVRIGREIHLRTHLLQRPHDGERIPRIVIDDSHL